MGDPAKPAPSVLVVVGEPVRTGPLASLPWKPVEEYLEGGDGCLEEKAVVVNLCRSYQSLSRGYYVSLLAGARGQRAFPPVEAIEELGNPFATFRSLKEAGIRTVDLRAMKGRRLLPRALGAGGGPGEESGFAEVVSVFGKTLSASFRRPCAAIFRVFPFPLLRIRLYREEGVWRVGQLSPLGLTQVAPAELALLARALEERDFVEVPVAAGSSRPPRIACLFDPDDPYAPSDERALDRFARVAQRRGILFERIGRGDLARLAEYDALLLRTVTALDHYSFAFAQRAATYDMPVIDDPVSIMRCSNKVFLHELFRTHGLPTPRTRTVSRKTPLGELDELGFPVIVKLPEGTFSAAVKKAASREELESVTREMLRHSPVLIVQEFVPTPFDWRVCVLDRRPLLACKYHMVEGHWQILRHSGGGRTRYGRVEAVALDAVPEPILELAVEAAGLIGRGLYGVDLKETERGPLVIEVNDNPNLEAGYEDAVEGDRVYEAILDHLLRLLEEKAAVEARKP